MMDARDGFFPNFHYNYQQFRQDFIVPPMIRRNDAAGVVMIDRGKSLMSTYASYGMIVLPLMLSSIALTELVRTRSSRKYMGYLYGVTTAFSVPTIGCLCGVFYGSLLSTTGVLMSFFSNDGGNYC